MKDIFLETSPKKKTNKDKGFLVTYLDSAEQTSINQVNWCPQLERLLEVHGKL